jgi:hypothetical protein
MSAEISTVDKLRPPDQAKIVIAAGKDVLEVFEVPCPILPATPRLRRKLAALGKLLVKAYRKEWGEELELKHDFWGVLRALRRQDAFVVVAKPGRLASLPDLVGMEIATYLNQEQLVWSINADLALGSSPNPHIELEHLPDDFPPEVIYYNEHFIDERCRHGVVPIMPLNHRLARSLLDRYAPETPVVALTPGHRAGDPDKLFPIMSFAMQMGMHKIDLPHVERHDRFIYWIPLEDLFRAVQPPFTKENFSIQVALVKEKRDRAHKDTA